MKNLLLFSTLLLTTLGAFAQLTVKPNGASDSYVYVNDQIVYVTQEINLTRNSTLNDTEASIYLRNNGQLIQGGTTSSNSGDGHLSVQQNTPETNAWAYYYWASPVGYSGNLGAPQPAGNPWAGVKNIYEPLGVTAAQQAATTTGRDGTISPMTISTRWLYTFKTPGTEALGNYTRINSGTAVPPGFGFTMKGVGLVTPGPDQVYEFRGRPNSGTFTIPVAAPTGVPVEGQMTLAGNPYPSALDLNKLFYDSPDNDALGTFWYYDEDRTVASHYYTDKPYGYGVYTIGAEDTDGDPYNGNNLGTYVAAPFYIWNSAGNHGGSVATSSNSDLNKRFAPIGQGIMFVGAATGTVKIKNAHRVFFKEDTAGSVFQRPGTNENGEVSTENSPDGILGADSANISADNRTSGMRLWVVFDEAITRDMVLNFSDQATDGYDRGLDGMSPLGLKTDAYFPVGNDNNRLPYVISTINFAANKQVPIAFKLNKTTDIQVYLKEEIKKPYQQAYLFDSQENTYQNLSINGGRPSIINLPAGTYDNRFFIVFRNPNVKKDIPQSELEAKNTVLANVNFFQNNPQHQLEVKNPEGYTIKSAAVYDMSGKLVISEKNLGANNTYSFYTGNLSDGVYLVKLMTADDIAIDYKAIVHNQ